MPEPTVTWTGLVPSTSGRRNKRTGKVQEYRVVLFSDGTATCDCPAQIFRNTRGPDTPSTPLGCKHTEAARRAQGRAPEVATPPRAPAAGPTKGATPPPAEPDAFLSEFEDDALLDLPQIRHERS